jgi:hypothetical protein
MFNLVNVNGNLYRVFDFNTTYDYLRDVVGVGEEALDLAFSLNGQNEKTASDILFYYTGWSDFDAHAKDLQEM